MAERTERFRQVLIEDSGLSELPSELKNSFLDAATAELELRVGIRLAGRMSEEQLAKFEEYFEKSDDEGALRFLQAELPEYQEVVRAEAETMRREIAARAPEILKAAGK